MSYAVSVWMAVLVWLPGPAGTVQAPQTDRKVSGVVLRADTEMPVSDAIVSSGGRQVVSDKDGRFVLAVPAAKVIVEVTAPGFFLLTAPVDATDRSVLDLRLSIAPNPSFTSQVDVVAAAPASAPSATPVAPRDVLATAGALDNVFRTLQTLPGVAATEEFGSRLTVRGGAPDQNLTVMDGVEIHDPYRLFGLTSAFNPETIQRFELATGGFSAKYGDRLSSLLIIENRDGDRTRRLAGSASLSITDTNLVLEGKLPGDMRGSWMVTGRRTYYDLVASRISNQDFPSFGDVQAKGVWQSERGRKLTVFVLRSRQSAALNIDDGRASGEFSNDTRNDLAWARLDSALGSRGHVMTVAGYSRTLSTVGVAALFENRSQRTNAPDAEFDLANVTFSQRVQVRDASLRHEFIWSLGAHTLEVGGEVHHLTTGLKYVIDGDRNPAAANGSSVQGGAGLPDLLDSRRISTRGGGWLIDVWRPDPRANIEAGVRIDRAGINRETTLSPRASASWAFTSRLRLSASAGQYTQSPGYEKAAQSDYVLEFTPDTTRALKSERARITSLGVQYTIGAGVTARIDTFHKRLTDTLIGRLETNAEQVARVSRYDFPAALASSIPTDPIITTVPTNGGRGRAYGFDVMLTRLAPPADARLRGWASYTWGKAERTAYGRTYPFEYDRRQAISAVLSYRLSPKWALASTIRWANGFPRTPPLGVRVAGREDTADEDRDGITDEIRPAHDAAGRLAYVVNLGGVANLNRSRLPDFARTDVRVSWKPRGPNGRWEFYAEVINLLDRKNAGALTAELAYDPTSDRPRITEVSDQSIPRLPTLGLRWRF